MSSTALPPLFSKTLMDSGVTTEEDLGFLVFSAGKVFLEGNDSASNKEVMKHKLGDLLSFL